jgi:hypothetical protein
VKSLTRPAFADLSEDARRVLNASDAVLLFEGKSGHTFYDALDDIRMAGLLNLIAKTSATAFLSERTALSYVTKLTGLEGDRFHAVVARELRAEIAHGVTADLFHEVNGALHQPPEGYALAGSYKTEDHYGNLQLTLFAKGDEWCADIDIDDAAGLQHAFQVVGNAVRHRPTHPYAIHEILMHHQRLDPGYSLVV